MVMTPWIKCLKESPLWKVLESQLTMPTQRNQHKRVIFWEKAQPQSTGAGWARQAGTCTQETRWAERPSKDKRADKKDQSGSASTSTNQGQAASSRSPSGWGKTFQVLTRLERNKSWNLGNGCDHSRLSPRILQESTNQTDLPDFIPLSSTDCSNGSGSARPSEKGGDRNMLGFKWFLQPDLHSAKKGRGLATDYKPESLKSVPPYSALQDGEHLYPQRYFERGRLYGKNRPERRIFQCQNSSRAQTVLEVPLEGSSLPIQSSSFWVGHSPQSFFEDHAGGYKALAGEECAVGSIPRRYFSHSQLTQEAHHHVSSVPTEAGLHSERQEVHLQTGANY